MSDLIRLTKLLAKTGFWLFIIFFWIPATAVSIWNLYDYFFNLESLLKTSAMIGLPTNIAWLSLNAAFLLFLGLRKLRKAHKKTRSDNL